MIDRAKHVLKTVFGYDQFISLQQDVIENVLRRRDALVIMPTGGGKPLCYQIPALVLERLTAVVSHLIFLMTPSTSSRVTFASFRRKPESRSFKTSWTPVFTGVTAEATCHRAFWTPSKRILPSSAYIICVAVSPPSGVQPAIAAMRLNRTRQANSRVPSAATASVHR